MQTSLLSPFLILFFALSMPSQGITQNPLPECPDSPNCERSSVVLEFSIEHVLTVSLEVLKKMKAHEIEQKENGEIHAIFRIPIFGWKDDVNIKLEETNEGTIVYIRSASRTGYSDLGVNKRRVSRLIRWLQNDLKAMHQ